MTDFELVIELLERGYKVSPLQLPANFNKGNVYISLSFEDGELKNVEVF